MAPHRRRLQDWAGRHADRGEGPLSSGRCSGTAVLRRPPVQGPGRQRGSRQGQQRPCCWPRLQLQQAESYARSRGCMCGAGCLQASTLSSGMRTLSFWHEMPQQSSACLAPCSVVRALNGQRRPACRHARMCSARKYVCYAKADIWAKLLSKHFGHYDVTAVLFCSLCCSLRTFSPSLVAPLTKLCCTSSAQLAL